MQWLMLKQLLVLSVLCITGAHLRDDLLEANAPFAAPAIPDPPLPANRPLFYKSHSKHFSPRGAPKLVLSPSQPPYYSPLTTTTHPPSRSRLSKLSMKKSGVAPSSEGLAPPRLANISPTQSTGGTIPSGLAQPPLSPYTSNCCGPDTVLKRGSEGCNCVYPIKLDLLLLNVSSNPNWNTFLQDFALQLGLQVSQINLIDFYMVGLSRLNISMDITPHTGIGFSASEASAINSSLSMHKVHLDPTLVGDYELLNITWFKPLAPSQVGSSFQLDSLSLSVQVRVAHHNFIFFYTWSLNVKNEYSINNGGRLYVIPKTNMCLPNITDKYRQTNICPSQLYFLLHLSLNVKNENSINNGGKLYVIPKGKDKYVFSPIIAMPPAEVPPLLPSTRIEHDDSNNGKHPNLILIVGIVAGMLIIAIIAGLIIVNVEIKVLCLY